jgi:hypothetical protein
MLARLLGFCFCSAPTVPAWQYRLAVWGPHPLLPWRCSFFTTGWQSDTVTHDPAADQHDQADDRRNSDPDAVTGRALRHHFELEDGVAEGKNGKHAQYPQIASS